MRAVCCAVTLSPSINVSVKEKASPSMAKVYVVGVYDTADPEDSEPRPPLALGLILFPLTLYADAILLVVTEGESTVSEHLKIIL